MLYFLVRMRLCSCLNLFTSPLLLDSCCTDLMNLIQILYQCPLGQTTWLDWLDIFSITQIYIHHTVLNFEDLIKDFARKKSRRKHFKFQFLFLFRNTCIDTYSILLLEDSFLVFSFLLFILIKSLETWLGNQLGPTCIVLVILVL